MAIETYPTTSFKLKRTSRAGVLGTVYDLQLGEDGGPLFVEGSKEQAQSLALRLLMVQGEAWEEPRCGLPWHDLMGMKPPNLYLVRYEILQQLYEDERVQQVRSLDIRYEALTRKVNVEAQITTKDGSTVKVTL